MADNDKDQKNQGAPGAGAPPPPAEPKGVLAQALKAFGLVPAHVLKHRETDSGGVVIVTKGGIRLRFPEDLESVKLTSGSEVPRFKRLLRTQAHKDGVPIPKEKPAEAAE
jgi:hypothetical protein